MSQTLSEPATDQLQLLLGETVRDFYGGGAHLERWVPHVLSDRPTRRTIRFDLTVRTRDAGLFQASWVGKFYDREETAGRVFGVLNALESASGETLAVPRVVHYAPVLRLLLLIFEEGTHVFSAPEHDWPKILRAAGSALTELHRSRIKVDRAISPATILTELRGRVAVLCQQYPTQSTFIQRAFVSFTTSAPPAPESPVLLHGDLGPAQFLWRPSGLVMLDLDKCVMGDPSFDLGHLFAQFRRRAALQPGSLPQFSAAQQGILDAYQCRPADLRGLADRIAWYERVVLLRKAFFLSQYSIQAKRQEAMLLLSELSRLV